MSRVAKTYVLNDSKEQWTIAALMKYMYIHVHTCMHVRMFIKPWSVVVRNMPAWLIEELPCCHNPVTQ